MNDKKYNVWFRDKPHVFQMIIFAKNSTEAKKKFINNWFVVEENSKKDIALKKAHKKAHGL